MSDRIKLGDMKVANIRHLLVKEPAVINKKQGIEDLLAGMIEDSRTRHIYVVDDAGILVGVVRMNRVVRYLFPFAAMIEQGSELSIGSLANFEAETVQDIMDDHPHFVKESTSLSKMADILIQQKINEIPVVGDDMRLVGQINVYEVIMAYLKEKRGSDPNSIT